jgi:putative RNA 2'-phosphotransferase
MVEVNDLLTALRRDPKWSLVQYDDIIKMIIISEKKRHEICENRIRAFYGHSIPEKITKPPIEPPEILYHGTARLNVNKIMREGLKSGSRQYVHLSQDIDTAFQVGRRRDRNPAVLAIIAKSAYNDGISFYFGNETVWLSDDIPSQYIVPENTSETGNVV